MAGDKINIFRAVRLARATKDTDGEFSIKFRKWNREKGQGGDLCHIQRARCRPAPKKDDLVNAEAKLYFIDLDRMLPMVCWQCLIVEYNGMGCVLE